MAKLEIVLEGDPRLRQKATRVKHVDDSLRRLAYPTEADAGARR